MPPVLTSDYDYDTFRPCFLPDPPPRCQLLPGPGEDIWKKFELLPTPPLSPSRAPFPPDAALPAAALPAAAHLEAVSELLDEDCGSTSFLQSFIIQDCMWSSSFAAATKLERAVSERLASLRARHDSAPSAGGEAGGRQVNAEYLQDLHPAAAHCVDPSAVFPPTSAGGGGASVKTELNLESPPLSSSESEEEDEEEEEEEEDDEVDVVTVDGLRTPRRAGPFPMVLKRPPHVDVHQHNYAAQQPAVKRVKAEAPAARPCGGGGGGGRRCGSPRSDDSDSDRRRTHNVLERQRRDELKRSFEALREEIPAVAGDRKAAKVAILRTAAELIRAMRAEERRLQAAGDGLRGRSRALRRRLQQLGTR
ncbi:transcriptional regulator Myc-like [Cololabis saira]|uniref:transcriptional regulator Myc-like n=1 Tax=Cololabis saira TaxID=129043 RepID=UPI002AD51E23|nr:transcriptional regulator Myc-like [Cololabis saira]